jgi:hypothetical protein
MLSLMHLELFCKFEIVLNFKKKSGIVVHLCNPSIWEAEAEGSGVEGQFGLHGETLSQTKHIFFFAHPSIKLFLANS